AVESFRLMLDLAQEIVLRGFVELAAIIDEAGGGAKNRGQRRAKIVGDRSEQRVAHLLGFGGGARLQHLAREQRALERRRRLLGERAEQRARFGIERSALRIAADADDANDASRRP